jgi:hypothetical protein
MTVDRSRASSVRREVAHAYAAGARGLVVCVASGAVGGLLGLLTTRNLLWLYVGGFVGFLVGVVLGVVTAAVGVGVSRFRSGLAMFTACGVAAGMFALFRHHSWVFVVVVLSLPGFAVAMGSLPRQLLRSLVVFAAGTAALVGVLLLDVWVGESSDVRQVERRVASAGVDVWAPPMGPGCDIRVDRGAQVEYQRTDCDDDPVFVTVVLRSDPGAALGPNPQVDVSSRPQPGGRDRRPPVPAVASMRRGNTVIEVQSPSARLALAVAQGMRQQDAAWLATRETPLHGWVHDLQRSVRR